MCGILFGLNVPEPDDFILTHRGPDDKKRVTYDNCFMEFTRLSINDVSSDGMQPFVNNDKITTNTDGTTQSEKTNMSKAVKPKAD
jgi:asparagine synthase (glutamine-hydrolysing)